MTYFDTKSRFDLCVFQRPGLKGHGSLNFCPPTPHCPIILLLCEEAHPGLLSHERPHREQSLPSDCPAPVNTHTWWNPSQTIRWQSCLSGPSWDQKTAQPTPNKTAEFWANQQVLLESLSLESFERKKQKTDPNLGARTYRATIIIIIWGLGGGEKPGKLWKDN